MLTAIVIAADEERGNILRHLALETGQLLILRELAGFPTLYELSRLLNNVEPDLVILDLGAGQRAFECAAEIRARTPETPLIGFGCRPEQVALAQALSFASLLGDTVQAGEMLMAIDEAVHRVRGGVEPHLYSVLPAKAGSGASTVVFNLAAALASALGKKVLVIEADLRSGILGVMLNLTPRHSIQDLLRQATDLDPFRWENAVHRASQTHWLLTTRAIDATLPSWKEYYQVLNFARSRYDVILVDLPELINPGTVEIVRRSQKVFSVTTAEVLSLKMAEQRAAELAHWGVPEERHAVILNRFNKSDLGPGDVERLLRRPVFRVLPNDYPAVRRSVMDGVPVQSETRLGKAYLNLAHQLMGVAEPPQSSLADKLKDLMGLRSQPREASPARRAS